MQALTEIVTLGRTLKKRATDVLACFDRPGTSNGPTGRDQRPTRAPARLRARVPQPHPLHRQSLLETGGFRPHLDPDCEEPDSSGASVDDGVVEQGGLRAVLAEFL